MRNDSHEMRFANRGDLHHFSNATDIRQRCTNVIDVVLFYQLVEVPAVAPFFSGRDRHFGLAPQQRQVFQKCLRAYRIFDEVGSQVLDQAASAHCFGKIEALVKVDAPVAVLTDAIAGLDAVFVELVETLVSVEGGIDGTVGRPIRNAR